MSGGVFIFTGLVSGGLGALAIARVYNIHKAKPAMEEYIEHIGWVHEKWAFQMPFTYPQTGPDPRGPVRRTMAVPDSGVARPNS